MLSTAGLEAGHPLPDRWDQAQAETPDPLHSSPFLPTLNPGNPLTYFLWLDLPDVRYKWSCATCDLGLASLRSLMCSRPIRVGARVGFCSI